MKRMKVFSIVIVSILLIVTLGKITFASTVVGTANAPSKETKANLSPSGTNTIAFWDLVSTYQPMVNMYNNYSNLYCTQFSTNVGGSKYRINYLMKIEGDEVTVTFYNYNSSTDKLTAGTKLTKSGSEHSNKIAAALYADENSEYSHDGIKAASGDKTWFISYGQLAVWQYWDSFIKEITTNSTHLENLGYGEKNSEYDDEYGKYATTAVNETKTIAAKGKYSATIYGLANPSESEAQHIFAVDSTDIENVTINKILTKVWEDDNNEYGNRPSKITVTLYADGEKVKTQEISGDSTADKWTYKFTGLPEYNDDGTAIKYTVSETTVPTGYTSKVSGFIITNTPKTTTYKAIKTWDDNGNQDGIRPSTIKINLLADGSIFTSYEVSAGNVKNEWSYTFTDLPVYINKSKVTYTVDEVLPDGYTKNISGNKIINTHEPEVVKITVKKVWDDDDNRDGLRPDSIVVKILADGGTATDCNGNSIGEITLNEANDWTYTTTNCYKYKEGKVGQEIDYTVEEAVPDGYTVSIKESDQENEYLVSTVTNTHKPETIEIPVEKIWNNNVGGTIPDSIQVKLLANGEIATDSNGDEIGLVTLDESNSWKHTFTDLYKYEDGKEIVYTVEEIIEDKKDENGTVIETYNYDTEITKVTNSDGSYGFKITNTYYDGYKVITGKVWLDKADGKANKINGAMDSDEKGIEGIKVILKDEKGNQFDATSTATTDENGKYIIKVNYDNSNNVYKLYEDVETVNEKLKTAYVEFEYDGLLYTTVATLTADQVAEYNETTEASRNDSDTTNDIPEITEEDISRAIENESERAILDDGYDSVNSGTPPLDCIVNDEGVPQLEEGEDNANGYWNNRTITASTKDVIDFGQDENGNNLYSYRETTQDEKIIKYCSGNGYYTRTNPNGAWNDPITDSTKHTQECTGEEHTKTYNVDIEVISNVNLGLFTREQPDVGITSDICKVEVEMNKQKYTYLYSVRDEVLSATDIQTQFQNKDTYEYKRPVNPANIAESGADNIEVYVTYSIKIGNQSTTLPITVDSILNCFDSEYTIDSIVVGDMEIIRDESTQEIKEININGDTIATKESIPESDISTKEYEVDGNNLKHKEYILNLGNNAITVDPGKSAEDEIFIKYKISDTAIAGLLNNEPTLNNAVEILSYSTVYGEKTLYAEQRTGERTNKPYAGYDFDSHPGNAAIKLVKCIDTDENENEVTVYRLQSTENLVEYTSLDGTTKIGPEDDTDIAPSFALVADDEKILSGNVWEDADANTSDNARIGDGKKDDTEKDLANAKIELYKVNDDGSTELAYLYSADETKAEIPAVTYSDSNGNYAFGNEDYGVVTDRYIMKFTYGEDIEKTENPSDKITSTIDGANVNARNYKSTIISDPVLKGIIEGTDTSDEWHLNIDKGYSVAVDNMEQRVAIDDLQYNNFNNKLYIFAETKLFEMQVEFNPNADKTEKVDENGKSQYGKELSVFDFGIIERPREDIYVENGIEYITVTLANGQILTKGNPNTETLSYTKPMGFNQVIQNGTDARTAIDKRILVEMDAELIQGATLEVKYTVKVTNNSEVDYDYYLGDETAGYDPSKVRTEYYYFGTNTEGTPVVTSSVNKLVDYADSDLTFKWDTPDNWEEKQAKELYDAGYIGDAAYNMLSSNSYKTYVTTVFQDIAPKVNDGDINYKIEKATATRLLANQDENIYENHAEILELDSKTARTIKETGITKEYKMGNYVPSLETRQPNDDINSEEEGLHEQDDDRIRVIITSSTGVTNYIIPYVIATLVGLIIIVLGVVFIKKKVLTK